MCVKSDTLPIIVKHEAVSTILDLRNKPGFSTGSFAGVGEPVVDVGFKPHPLRLFIQ